MYKPPKVSHLCDLETPLLNLLPYYEHFILMDDLNTNLLAKDSYSTKQLQTMFQSCNMMILSSEPTHHTNLTDTLLDIIVTHNPQEVIISGQLAVSAISAHDMIYTEYTLQCPKS